MDVQTLELYATDNIPQIRETNIIDRVVGLNLEFRRLGTTRKVTVKRDAPDVDGVIARGVKDLELLKANKKILECGELQDIETFDLQTRNLVNSRAIPTEFRGTILLPLKALGETVKLLKARGAAREKLVQAFVARYDAILADMQQRLGAEWNPKNYKRVEQVEQQFSMQWQPFSFSTPEGLQGAEKQIFIEEIQARGATMAEEIKLAMREMMAELVDHMVERLTVKPGEKPKTFRDSLISNRRDFLETFDGRNEVIQDWQLKNLANTARDLLNGLDPETLRQSDTVRERIAESVQKIKAELDTMIVQRPSRKVKFD